MNLETDITIDYRVHVELDAEWPDCSWPSWKPETEKSFRPERAYVKLHWSGSSVTCNLVEVYGPRVSKNGALGSEVKNTYYLQEKSCPDFVKEFHSEALLRFHAVLRNMGLHDSNDT